jgi:uncharacterized protein YeaO (DUF488 family)
MPVRSDSEAARVAASTDLEERETMIQIKRAYEPRAPSDGMRVLVERLWPRGVTKEALAGDAWMRDVAPSTELRKWFAHRIDRWAEFQRRYRAELDTNPAAWAPIHDAGLDGIVTLLYSARDTAHNGAVVLRDYLAEREAERHGSKRARPREVARVRAGR